MFQQVSFVKKYLGKEEWASGPGFDKDDVMWCNTAFGDYPVIFLP